MSMRLAGLEEGARPRHRGRRAAGWTLGGLVLLAGAYAGAAVWAGGTVPKDTTVGGTAIGGLSGSAAQHRIDAVAAKQASVPVTIAAGGKTLTVQPGDAGLSFDTGRALDDLAGFTLSPARLLQHLTGGPHRTMPHSVDRVALSDAVQQAGESIHGAPVNGSVKFNHGRVDVVASTPGTGIDAKAVSHSIAEGWPAKHRFQATVSSRPAPLTNDEIDQFVSSFAKKAMSAPVTVKAGSNSIRLTPTMVSGVLSANVTNGTIRPVVDPRKLDTLLGKVGGGLVAEPVNATVRIVDGRPHVIPAKDGSTIDTEGADKALLAALVAPNRTMTVHTRPAKPKITTAEVKKDIKSTNGKQELMSQFVSDFPTGPQNAARTHNIAVALAEINGTYVAPGEQFSLLRALAPITAASGYINAPVLVGGVDVPGMGGGISQVSTTMYNATFFAGLQEDQHTAHSYWISRYPMGREATLWVPTIDNRWTNDSGHGIIIKAGIEGHAAVIRLYGKKVFTVTSHTGQPFHIVAPKTRVLHTRHCMTQPPVNGFDVTVTRVVRRDGKVVKNESLTTRYQPADRVICE